MSLTVKRAESRWELAQVREIRHRVFVEEQGVPEHMEGDELDAEAVHAVALWNGRAVGTGRVAPIGVDEGRIGRMAVVRPWRGRGIGGAVLAFLEDHAHSTGISRISLHAQLHATEFYARRGYAKEGSPFAEAGIPHVEMSKFLNDGETPALSPACRGRRTPVAGPLSASNSRRPPSDLS